MNHSFLKLKKPLIVLAPIAGISDSPFRQVCKEQGADLTYTELISAEGLSRGQKKTIQLIKFKVKERPIILQLFGKRPEAFGKAAALIENLSKNEKPDGIDLNCGCPAKKVKGHGSGIALMREPELVNLIIKEIQKNTDLPISIKIRAGIKKENIFASEFIKNLDLEKLKMIAIHGRYLEDGFSGPIDYKEIQKVKNLCPNKVVIGNGGILDLESVEIMLKTGVDGLMIGQAAFGNPWIFKEIKLSFTGKKFKKPTQTEKFKIIKKHAKLMVELKGEEKGMREMRKHLIWYFKGIEGAKSLRRELVLIERYRELDSLLEKLNHSELKA